ncbi:MAG: glycosyltransferase [Chloroflexaceae bacterium]|nr:glycosyltransferase [Chloroflexaceae bacterium]
MGCWRWQLGLWIALGLGLRLIGLEEKPPWADEWATLVFSLGHSFQTIPLDRPISGAMLLQPVQLDPTVGPREVVGNLFRESTHPPLYFLLAHGWLKLVSGENTLVSLGLARLLSALLGVAAIPAMYGLGYLSFGTRLAGHLAAALMAVSPYGIYLAQEARHYTLAILGIIASLACAIAAVKRYQSRQLPPIWLIFVWIGANTLGMASHYFLALTIAAQGLAFLPWWWRDRPWSRKPIFPGFWGRLAGVGLGTALGSAIWLVDWYGIPGDRLTSWINHGEVWGWDFLSPLLRLAGWLVTMVFLLPFENVPLLVAILSGILLVGLLVWFVPKLWRFWRQLLNDPLVQWETRFLSRFVVSSWGLILGFTYLADIDLTLAARYQFVYFPAVLAIAAGILAQAWQTGVKPDKPSRWSPQFGKRFVVVTLVAGLMGSLAVAAHLAYQKSDRPDLVVAAIERQSEEAVPILVATVHKTHEQTGEMLGLAWEWRNNPQRLAQTQFCWLTNPAKRGNL